MVCTWPAFTSQGPERTKLRYFIPVLGYMLILRSQPHGVNRHNAKIIAFNTTPFWLGLVIPPLENYLLNLRFTVVTLAVTAFLLDAVLFFFIPIVTHIETGWVAQGKFHSSWLYRSAGWDQFDGQPLSEVRRRFLVFNYHELVFAMVGLTISLAIQAALL